MVVVHIAHRLPVCQTPTQCMLHCQLVRRTLGLTCSRRWELFGLYSLLFCGCPLHSTNHLKFGVIFLSCFYQTIAYSHKALIQLMNSTLVYRASIFSAFQLENKGINIIIVRGKSLSASWSQVSGGSSVNKDLSSTANMLAPTNELNCSWSTDVSSHMDWEYVCGLRNCIEQPSCSTWQDNYSSKSLLYKVLLRHTLVLYGLYLKALP